MSKIIKAPKIAQNPVQLETSFDPVSIVNRRIGVSGGLVDKSKNEAVEELAKNAEAYVDQAKEQAQAIITEAEAAAERLIVEAQQEAQHLKHEAIEQGQMLGYEEGKQQGYSETERLLHDAAHIVEHAKKERQEIIEQCEKDILELALAVAARVIHTEITINHDIVLAVVKDAIRKAKDQERVVIRVNPDDFEIVAEEKVNLRALVGREIGMDVRGDIGVDPGGCVIETDYGTIDARIDTQMETVKKALLGMVKHA